MDIIKNPHDTLFKRTLSDKEVAKNFLKNYLPQELLNEVDLEEIKIVKNSFVDKDLKESFSDIIYNVKINGMEGYIYLLLEHKSYIDKMVPVQLLRYITDIWELYRKQTDAGSLPPIIPIILYHGKQKWNIGSKLSNILDYIPRGLMKYVPDYNYLLYDFSVYTDEEIKGKVKLQLFLRLFSHIFSGDFEKILRQIIPLLNELDSQETGMDYIETVVRYILSTNDVMSLEELKETAKKISFERGEVIVTIAERLIQEGKVEAMQEMIEFALEIKFGMSSKFLVKDIKKINDYEKLKEIKFAIKNYDSLEEFTKNIDI